MKKKNVLNLVKYYVEKNDTALTTGSQRKLSEEDRGLLDVFAADHGASGA